MEDAPDSPAILTVFRSRLRPEAASLGYHELADEVERRARTMPGFVEFKTFTADDGERVSIVIFDSVDHHNAWRDDPEHVEAKQRGIEQFYAEYQITVAQVIHQHSHQVLDEDLKTMEGQSQVPPSRPQQSARPVILVAINTN